MLVYKGELREGGVPVGGGGRSPPFYILRLQIYNI